MAGRKRYRISRRLGAFRGDRRALIALMLVAMALAGRVWLDDHPQHNPWAPLHLEDPIGWATGSKIAALRSNLPACRAVLDRSQVAFAALEPQGEGACRRPDRTLLDTYPLAPRTPPTTCPVAVGLELWKRHGLDPIARDLFDSTIHEIQHLGVYSCRRVNGAESGSWSEHATGNAIDIAGFVLADGTTIRVSRDWEGDPAKSAFLRAVRDHACTTFSTVLSPDYNAAHSDHLHLDMDDRRSNICR